MFGRRKGFALGLVLVVMIVLIAMSAVIMDLTTNYTSSSQSVIDNEKLMNAAQSGVESGKSWLLANKGSIDKTKVSPVNSLSDITLYSDSFSIHNGKTTVDYNVLKCNYDPTGTNPASYDLPPVYEAYFPSGSGNIDSGVGTSTFIDPNRDLLGLTGGGHPVYVVRSTATSNGRSKELETMVVISND